MPSKHIDWEAVLFEAAKLCEDMYAVHLDIDKDVLKEIGVQTEESLLALNMTSLPNVAKVAGHAAFWIRKLKPITHAPESQHRLLTINECIAVIVGIGICRNYLDDHSKYHFNLPVRVMEDWIMSLRKHSHSPHSCAITFEFLASEN